MRPKNVVPLGGLALVLLGAASPIVEERLEVDWIAVDVAVEDGRQRPVRDLEVGDFVLREDGDEVEILALDRPEMTGPSNPPPGSQSARASRPARSGEDWLVVVVDRSQLSDAAFRRAIADLAGLEPRAPSSILVDLGPPVEILVGPASSEQEWRSGLAALAQRMPGGRRLRHEVRLTRNEIHHLTTIETPLGSGCVVFREEALAAARRQGDQILARAETSLRALEQIVAALGGLPGQKRLLFASAGLPQYPGLDLVHYLWELCGSDPSETPTVNLLSQVTKLAARANAGGVTIHPWDGAGAAVLTRSDAGYDDPPSLESENVRVANEQGTLFHLAGETGGRAFFNRSELASSLEGVAAEAARVYRLYFRPDHPPEGRSHLLSVEVERRGARTRYPRSYVHKEAEQVLAERTVATLFFGIEDNALGVRLDAGERRQQDGETIVPLRLTIDLGRLTLLPAESGFRGRLELVVSRQDDSGRALTLRRREVPIAVPTEPVGHPEHTLEIAVPVGPGETRLAVAVRDFVGETVSLLRATVPAVAAGEPRIEVSSPPPEDPRGTR